MIKKINQQQLQHLVLIMLSLIVTYYFYEAIQYQQELVRQLHESREELYQAQQLFEQKLEKLAVESKPVETHWGLSKTQVVVAVVGGIFIAAVCFAGYHYLLPVLPPEIPPANNVVEKINDLTEMVSTVEVPKLNESLKKMTAYTKTAKETSTEYQTLERDLSNVNKGLFDLNKNIKRFLQEYVKTKK